MPQSVESRNLEPEKQGVRHQVAAMFKSIIAHEKTIEHLRTLIEQDASEDQVQENKDIIEDILSARKDLVERMKYLEVAYDYDWDTAKVFLEMKESNPSSMVLKAVTESKKRKAAERRRQRKRKRKWMQTITPSAAEGLDGDSISPCMPLSRYKPCRTYMGRCYRWAGSGRCNIFKERDSMGTECPMHRRSLSTGKPHRLLHLWRNAWLQEMPQRNVRNGYRTTSSSQATHSSPVRHYQYDRKRMREEL